MIREILRRHKVTTPELQNTSRPTTPVTSSAAAETEATSKTTQSHEKADDAATKKPPERTTEVSEVSSSVRDTHHGYSTRLPKLALP